MTRSILASAIALSLVACGGAGNEDATVGSGDAGSATPAAAHATSTQAAAPTPPETSPAGHSHDPAAETREFESERGTVRVTTLTDALTNPWGMAFLPDGRALVTERPGRLRFLDADGALSAPIEGVPEVMARGQGGLLDVALSPDFDSDGLVYLSYAEPDGDNSGTAVARGQLVNGGLQDVEVVFRQTPKLATGHHYGSRLVFHDGYLFVTLGDRGERPMAQELDGHQGTVVRIRPDGSVPDDNPFVGDDEALDEIWSYGHRNIQGAAVHPGTGALWTHEHGPRGGDEINLPTPGTNFGWPLVTHGINYSGEPIPEAVGTEMEGVQPAQHVWAVSPGVSGMAFYTHEAAPGWQGNLFVGALAQTELIRLELQGEQVRHEERLLGELGRRIRDVREGPDGALYLLTDHDDGEVLRVELLSRD